MDIDSTFTQSETYVPNNASPETARKEFIGATIAHVPQNGAIALIKEPIIKFISEQSVNYLTQEAPEAPVLLQAMHNGYYIPFLRKGIVGQLVGAGGIGKTHWFMQLALAVATRSEFLETYRINESGAVFMGLGENTDDDIHRLFHKHAKKMTAEQKAVAAQKISVMSFTGKQASFIKEDGNATDTYKKLLQALKEKEPTTGWTLIILDPISRFFGADVEKDNAAATNFIALLENMILELKGKPTLLFGHHMSKSGLGSTNSDQSAARGSSAITDGVRWQGNLEKVEAVSGSPEKYDNNKVRFKVVKSNFTMAPEPLLLEKNSVGCLIKCNEEIAAATIPLKQRLKASCTDQYI
jgi:hypothetical protein